MIRYAQIQSLYHSISLDFVLLTVCVCGFSVILSVNSCYCFAVTLKAEASFP
jgi:hypothetical protein